MAEAVSCVRCERPWLDGLTADLFGRHVPQRLGELPAVAREVLDRAIPLAILPVGRRLEHAGPVDTGPLELGVDIVHAYPDEMGHDTILGRLLLASDIGDDHRPVLTDAELRPMVLADSSSLDKSKRLSQPGNRGAHIWIDEHRNDSGGRDGAVAPHLPILWPLQIGSYRRHRAAR